MLKKPLFWIIVVIVIVVLWFVFAGGGKQEAEKAYNSVSPAVTAPVTTTGSSASQGSAQ